LKDFIEGRCDSFTSDVLYSGKAAEELVEKYNFCRTSAEWLP
jgi:hypothetical protein